MTEHTFGATPVDDGTESPQTFKYDLFSLQKQDINPLLGGRKLQDVYGIAREEGGIPSFEWVKTIKSGERTYTETSAADRARMEQYRKDYAAATAEQRAGMPTPEEIIAEVAPLAGQVAEGIGSSLATGGTVMEGLPFVDSGMDVALGTTNFNPGALKNLTNVQKTALQKTPSFTAAGNVDTAEAAKALKVSEAELSDLGATVGRNQAQDATFSELLNPRNPAGAQNIKGALGGAVGNFAIQLALGQDPVKAAKSAGAGAIGKVLGTAIGGPIGGFIGGALGSIIGGRVICNELMRQGLLTRKQVVLDYRFTRDYLTPTHVNGYHVWAVWMVKQMRQGKFVKFWKYYRQEK